jgi:hypothetical protein
MNRQILAIMLFYMINGTLAAHLAGVLLHWPGGLTFAVSCLVSGSLGIDAALRGLHQAIHTDE